MKKWLTIVLSCLLALGALCACNENETGASKVQVYAPDGAPAIGLSKLMHDGMENTEFHVVAPDTIGGRVLNGSADIAIMPTNAAAMLRTARNADIAMLGVTNFGSLYLVGTEAVENLAALKGKTVYSIGQGNVPDLVFRYLLRQADIEYAFEGTDANKVTLKYVSEGSAFIGGLKADTMQYGVVSEPAATMAAKQTQNKASKLLSLQTLYEQATGTSHGFPQAALVVKKSFYTANPDYVKAFVAAFTEGVTWSAQSDDNAAAALAAMKDAGSTAVGALNSAIAQGCNLGFTAAADCKQQLLDFYAALKGVAEEGETPVGNAMPSDDFFLGA